MSARIFLLSRRADKEANKLPLRVQIKINEAFKEIKNNPRSGHKLKGELDDYFKYRVGDYRVIYAFDAKESKLEIIRIEHRQGVYK